MYVKAGHDDFADGGECYDDYDDAQVDYEAPNEGAVNQADETSQHNVAKEDEGKYETEHDSEHSHDAETIVLNAYNRSICMHS